MKKYFSDLVQLAKNNCQNSEVFTLWFSAEALDYARFNQGKIRQAGTAFQQYLSLNLKRGQKHATRTLGLSRHLTNDEALIKDAFTKLRAHLEHSDDDPYAMINESSNSSEHIAQSTLQDKSFIIEEILKSAQGLDLVGCYLGGPIYKGFANSFGQFNWFEKSSFVLDTSIYHSGDKAIKRSYSDTSFEPEVLKRKIEEARRGLALFDQETKILSPSSYRVYFAPAAVQEILAMLNWGGFSQKSLAVKSSPLLPLFNEQKKLSKLFSLSENTKGGVGPNFQTQGYVKPACQEIIRNGQLISTLISPKTAKEYNLKHNGADDDETMCAMDMAAGDLEDRDILSTLHDGLYINNLWYLNFSDRINGCLTGMTRFFCYSVKNGRPEAPIGVMRFDDSIYRIFGDNLEHTTKNRDMIIDNGSYDERSTSCATVPGIIAENVRFTL